MGVSSWLYYKNNITIQSRWGRDFPSVQTGPGAHPASCTMFTEFFLGVGGRGVGLTPPPSSIYVLKVLEKSRAILLLTLRVCMAYKKG